MSVCLSLATFPHYSTDPDVTWGNGRGASNCALLCGFAIGARVLLLYDSIHVCKLIALYTANANTAEHKMSASACTRSVAGFLCVCVCLYVGHTINKIDKLWQQMSRRGVFRRGQNLPGLAGLDVQQGFTARGPCCTSSPRLVNFGTGCPPGAKILKV